MSMRNKGKILTSGGDALVYNAFEGLDSTNSEIKNAADLVPGNATKFHTTRDASVDKKSSASMGRVEIRREKAGRSGKTVTTLHEFSMHLPQGELERLCYELKKYCACGGTFKGRVIELQGDVRARAFEFLQQHGYVPVRSGG